MSPSLNAINALPGVGMVPKPQEAVRPLHHTSQASPPDPGAMTTSPLAQINLAATGGASKPELSAPLETSALTEHETTTLRYHEVAEAMRRLIAGTSLPSALPNSV